MLFFGGWVGVNVEYNDDIVHSDMMTGSFADEIISPVYLTTFSSMIQYFLAAEGSSAFIHSLLKRKRITHERRSDRRDQFRWRQKMCGPH